MSNPIKTSRELKFRIWAMLDGELCKWSTGAKEDFNECHLTFEYGKLVFYIDHLIDECVNGEHEQYTRAEEAEIISLEQFTGLKDKNGTDIYEGDIIVYGEFAINDTEKYGEDCYKNLPTGVNRDDISTIKSTHEVDFSISSLKAIKEAMESNPDVSGIEVIGNIHENPELLEN